MSIQELMIYRRLKDDEIFSKITGVIDHCEIQVCSEEDMLTALYDGIFGLIGQAQDKGLKGNLWQAYLSLLLVQDENAFSRFCEKKGELKGSMHDLVLHDLAIIRRYLHYSFERMEEKLDTQFFNYISDFHPDRAKGTVFNKELAGKINELAVHLSESSDEEEMYQYLVSFYDDFGVGKFGMHKSFRIKHAHPQAQIIPITNSEQIRLDDLIGYELQKAQLIENTESFLKGGNANNVLLYGDSGTGKSSSVKAILNEYYLEGLRMIEIYKHQFKDLNSVIAQIKDRNYKFIIYMDDLSFEETELEYKYLKAVIEGGLEKKPDNVLIYATSNRRHLVKETWDDRRQFVDDVHGNDSKEEKMSLYTRFGLTIYYGSPVKKEFLDMVFAMADKEGLDYVPEELEQAAVRQELTQGSFSGRAAKQVIFKLQTKQGKHR